MVSYPWFRFSFPLHLVLIFSCLLLTRHIYWALSFTCVSASVPFLHTEQCLACHLFLFLWDFIDPATATPLLFLALCDCFCPTSLSCILSRYFLPLLSQRKEVPHWLLETPHIYKPLRGHRPSGMVTPTSLHYHPNRSSTFASIAAKVTKICFSKFLREPVALWLFVKQRRLNKICPVKQGLDSADGMTAPWGSVPLFYVLLFHLLHLPGNHLWPTQKMRRWGSKGLNNLIRDMSCP